MSEAYPVQIYSFHADPQGEVGRLVRSLVSNRKDGLCHTVEALLCELAPGERNGTQKHRAAAQRILEQSAGVQVVLCGSVIHSRVEIYAYARTPLEECNPRICSLRDLSLPEDLLSLIDTLTPPRLPAEASSSAGGMPDQLRAQLKRILSREGARKGLAAWLEFEPSSVEPDTVERAWSSGDLLARIRSGPSLVKHLRRSGGLTSLESVEVAGQLLSTLFTLHPPAAERKGAVDAEVEEARGLRRTLSLVLEKQTGRAAVNLSMDAEGQVLESEDEIVDRALANYFERLRERVPELTYAQAVSLLAEVYESYTVEVRDALRFGDSPEEIPPPVYLNIPEGCGVVTVQSPAFSRGPRIDGRDRS